MGRKGKLARSALVLATLLDASLLAAQIAQVVELRTADAAAAAGIALPDEPPLRTRDEVRAEIFNRKINAAADAYLAELRADAVIRKP